MMIIIIILLLFSIDSLSLSLVRSLSVKEFKSFFFIHFNFQNFMMIVS